MKKKFYCVYFLFLFILALSIPLSAAAEEKERLSNGQTVYVPVYSHIYIGNRERPFQLTVTLSIRNIDPQNALKVTKVDYYETQGDLLKVFLDKSITLKPLESTRYVLPEKEKVGGSGANFMVQWESDKSINPPIIESIMIGTTSGQGISFSSRGQAVYKTD